MSTVLIIADTQNPFEHQDYFDFIKAVYKKYQPDFMMHIGDEMDAHTLATYDPDPDGMSGGEELALTIKSLQKWYKKFPRMMVCESNHTSRIFRKAFRHGIPKGYLKDYKEFLEAPDYWEWAHSWEIDGVVYEHGEGYSGSQGAINAAKDNMKPTVIGHLHSDAGILTWANGDRLLWGMNVGCGIDKHKYAFQYGKLFRKKPILSCGVVIDGLQPLLIYMHLNRKGRWIGKL